MKKNRNISNNWSSSNNNNVLTSCTTDITLDSNWATTTNATIATTGTSWPLYNGTTITDNTLNVVWSPPSTVYPTVLKPGEEIWPEVADALGVVFIDDDLIKLKMKNGKEIIIGKLSDNEAEITPLEVIAAKKKLLEGSTEEGKE